MSLVELNSTNILENANSVVSLKSGVAEALQPLTRVFDRDIGLVFKTTTATTTIIHIDQSASGILAIDKLVIGNGHNLAGVIIDLEYSDDDAAWTPAVTQWTGAAGTIEKTWTSATHRYWRLTLTSPAAAVEITEIFLSPTYTWEKNPTTPVPQFDPVFNVIENFTSTGKPMYFEAGDEKRQRLYSVKNADATQKANILLFWSDWAGKYPFYIKDHLGELFFARIMVPLNITQNRGSSSYNFTFNAEEVLG